MGSWQQHVDAMTPTFRVVHAAIGQAVKARWPEAREEVVWPGTSYEMPAFVVPLADHPPKESWKGTMPADVFTVGPTQKKAGITIHVWHPNHPHALETHAAWLKEAGFKPMVGCLQWNRKAPIDLEAFGRLLDAL